MPNALVDHYRKFINPGSLESDDDITLKYIQDDSSRALQFPGVADDWKRIELRQRKAYAPSLFGEFKRAFGSGVDQTQAQLYDTAALAGDIVGIPALSQWGTEGYKRNIQEAAQNEPTLHGLDEISGIGDAARYVTALAGSQAPQLGLTAAAGALGGAAGGLIGGPVGAAEGAVEGAEAMLARQAAVKAATKALLARQALGTEIGGGIAGFTQMQNRGALREMPGVDPDSVTGTAVGTGLIGAALEALPITHLLGKMRAAKAGAEELVPRLIQTKWLTPITSHLPNNVYGHYLTRALQGVPEQAILEGGTEVLQELTTIAGEMYANRNNPQFQLNPDQVTKRLLESGVAGAILGGAAGGVESLSPHKPPGGTEPPPLPNLDAQQQAVAPPVSTGTTVDTDPALGNQRALAARNAAEAVRGVQDQQRARFLSGIGGLETSEALAGIAPGPKIELSPPETKTTTIETPAATTTVTTDPKTAEEKAAKARDLATEVDQVLGTPPPPQPKSPRSPFDIETVDFTGGPLTTTETTVGTRSQTEAKKAKAEREAAAKKLAEARANAGVDVTAERQAEEQAFEEHGVLPEEDTPETIEGKKRTVEKAFYLLHPDELVQQPTESLAGYIRRIGERLVSDASASKGNKAITRRVAFFQTQDGSIVGFPIYKKTDTKKNDGKPVYYVAGTTLDKFMGQGHVPLASALSSVDLNAAVKNNPNPTIFRYDNADDFANSLVHPAITKQQDAARNVAAMEAKMQAQGMDKEGEVIEKAGAAVEQPLSDMILTELGGERGLRELLTGSPLGAIGLDALKNPSARAMSAINNFVAHLAEVDPAAYQAAARDAFQNEDVKKELLGVSDVEQAKSLLERAVSVLTYEQIVAKVIGESGSTTRVASRIADPGQSPEGRRVEAAPAEEAKAAAEASVKPEKAKPEAIVLSPEEKAANEAKAQAIRDANEVKSKAAREEREAAKERELAEKEAESKAQKEKPLTAGEKSLLSLYAAFLEREDPDSKPVLNEDGTVTALHHEQIGEDAEGKSIYHSTPETSSRETMLAAAKHAEKEGWLKSDALASLPVTERQEKEPGRATTGDIKRRATMVQANAERMGMRFDILKALKKEMGAYRDKARKITLALFDAENPTADNLRLLLHEIAHDVSASLPDWMRTLVHQAIRGSSDEQLGIKHSKDPRITQENKAGLRQPILDEERLAESLAMKGVDRELSRSLAAQIVRKVKELFYDLAMGMQKIMGRTPSPALAKAYVENRFNRVVSGDRFVSAKREGSGNQRFLGADQIQGKASPTGKGMTKEEILRLVREEAKGQKEAVFPTKDNFIDATSEIWSHLRDSDKLLHGELVKAFKQFGINPKLKLTDWLRDKDGSVSRGIYDPDDGPNGTITMSRIANQTAKKFSRTLFHESLHAATSHAIQYAQDHARGLTSRPGYHEVPPDVEERILAGVDKLQKIYDQVKGSKQGKSAYGMTNLHEFVAEAFTNADFQQFLSSFKSTEKGKSTNLFQQFLDTLKDIFGISKRTTLDDVISTSGQIFEGKQTFSGDFFDQMMQDPSSLSKHLIPLPQGSIYSDGEELFSQPNSERFGERDDPKVISETNIAALNDRKEFEKKVDAQLQSVPSVVSTTASLSTPAKKVTPMEWFRKLMNFDNPEELHKAEVARAIDPTTGLTMNPNQDAKIGSFQAKQNNDLATYAALQAIGKQYEKLTAKNQEFRKDERDFDKQHTAAAEAHQAAVNSPVPVDPAEATRRTNRIATLAARALSHKETRDEARGNAEAGESVAGLYRQKQNELMGPLGAHKPVMFGEGAVFNVPQTPTATMVGPAAAVAPVAGSAAPATIQDLMGRAVSHGGPDTGFRPLTIKLDRHGNVTQQSEIQDAIDKMGDWLTAPGRVHDGEYHSVKQQQRELQIHAKYSPEMRKVDNTIMGSVLSSMSDQAKSLGSTLGRIVSKLINTYTAQHKFLMSPLTTMAREAGRAKHKASNALGMGLKFYMHNFYAPAINFLEDRRDIVEAHPGSFNKQLDEAMTAQFAKWKDSADIWPLIAGKEKKFMAAMREHLAAEYEIPTWLIDHFKNMNQGVKDARLGFTRDHLQHGVMMMPRRISAAFDAIYPSLVANGWPKLAAVVKGIASTYNTLGPDQARQELGGLFADPNVANEFFRPLVESTGTKSIFPAPRKDDGTQPEANPSYARKAREQSGGDPVRFAERMYDLHGGTSDKGQYVQDVIEVFSKVFNQMRNMRDDIDPGGSDTKDLKHMIPGLMLNAREIDHLPGQWFEPMSFDMHSIRRVVDRVAAQSAFGHENERFAKAYQDLVAEVEADTSKFSQDKEWVLNNVPKADEDKAIYKAALTQRVGGAKELERLKALEGRAQLVLNKSEGGSIAEQLVKYLNVKHSPHKPASFLRTGVNFLAQLMTNNPGSAIGQLAEPFAPVLSFGPGGSVLKMAGRSAADVGKGLIATLPGAMGMELKNNNRWEQRRQERGVTDYEKGTTFRDIRNEPSHPEESRPAVILRKIASTLNLAIGSSKGGTTGLRLLAPFKSANVEIFTKGVKNFWISVDEMVREGVKWAKANPTEFKHALADDDARNWGKRLGLSGEELNSFARIFQRALDEWGLDYHSLIKEGIQNEKTGNDLLSNHTLTQLQGMFIKETGAEPNAATIHSSVKTNDVTSLLSPLLGWSWIRSTKVGKLLLDEKEKRNYRALASNLGGLAVVGGAGLAVSMLVDLYNEDLQNKRRNLRRLSPNQDFSDFLKAVMEHSARVGTVGIAGDLGNSLFGSGTGSGDNRGVSLDQRTVFLNSIQGMIKALNAAVTQEGDIDYMHVIRPMIASMGGNGALQYLQIANTTLGLDNVESRAVNRTNVGNWLRVMGRELGMEVNTDRGGYSTPTPMTPKITRMQMAALADDREAFMEARLQAMALAREERRPDPAEYVARTFASRNPLKSVFRTPITEREYRELLAAMPESGRQDVMDAVNSFNRYGASLGLQPFEGKPVATTKAGKAAGREQARLFGGGSGRGGDVFGGDPFRQARDRATLF